MSRARRQGRLDIGKGQAPGMAIGRGVSGAATEDCNWVIGRGVRRFLGAADFFLAAFFLADFSVGFFLACAGAFAGRFPVIRFAGAFFRATVFFPAADFFPPVAVFFVAVFLRTVAVLRARFLVAGAERFTAFFTAFFTALVLRAGLAAPCFFPLLRFFALAMSNSFSRLQSRPVRANVSAGLHASCS